MAGKLDQVSQSIGQLQGSVEAIAKTQQTHIATVATMHADTQARIAALELSIGDRLKDHETDITKINTHIAHQKGVFAAVSTMAGFIGAWAHKLLSGLSG